MIARLMRRIIDVLIPEARQSWPEACECGSYNWNIRPFRRADGKECYGLTCRDCGRLRIVSVARMRWF